MKSRRGLDIAVIGVACVFPGAPDAATFWRNIEAGKDAVTEIDPDRMDPVFYDEARPDSRVDRLYCRRGGFLPEPLQFDAARYGIMPRAAEGADPDQLLALQVAERCLADAGYDHRSFDRSRVSVILGRGGYITPGLARLSQKVGGAEQLVQALRIVVPGVKEERLALIRKQFQERAGFFGPDTAIGLVPNLAASRIANRLDLGGTAYTVDAACASSLVALDHGCREIAAGRAEMALAGGLHLTQDPTIWAVFCQLGALSPTGCIRPFDRRADGLLIGEGCGLLLLKSGSAARRDGDSIYAYVRGVGVASDGRSSSLFSPLVAGQVRALEDAWREAGMLPSDIGLLEAHGTGTRAGDAAELATLARVFGRGANGVQPVMGSVKSNIGHCMPAAGAAGLIKAVMAIRHGVYPPTLHCEEPRKEIEETRFRVVAKAEPFESRQRVAAVNAFGFGGINAHVVLEAEGRAKRRKRIPLLARESVAVVAIAADSPAGILKALGLRLPRGGDGSCRLAMLDPSPERLSRARRIVERGVPWRGRHGIWFSPNALRRQGGKVVLLYPGVEASFEPKVEAVARVFELGAPTHLRPRNLEEKGRGVVSLGLFLHRVLLRLGVRPDGYAGHSIGEWTAMLASGILEEENVYRLLSGLRPGSLKVPGVLFAAAGCGIEQAREAVRDLEEIAISHDNCPHQVILCGRSDSIEEARDRLIGRGIMCQVLPFRSGFHSPLFEPYIEPHRRHFEALPIGRPAKPFYSATTCSPYPEEPEAVRELAVRHLIRPLRFRELLDRLYEDGFRIFIQVGIGSLSGFVEDALKGRQHLAVSACESGRPGLAQLRNLALALFAEGLSVDLKDLTPSMSSAGTVQVSLGAPLIEVSPELAIGQPLGDTEEESPLMKSFQEAVSSLTNSAREVAAAFSEAERESTHHELRRLSVHTVPALRDHAFFPQPEGWPVISDRYPVVPMTMTVGMLIEAAARVAGPDLAVVKLRDLEAFRWLLVEPEVEVRVKSRRTEGNEVETEIVDYARATALLAPGYPVPPEPDSKPLRNSRNAPIRASELYDDRYMFHGPRYQGVEEILELGDDGIRGRLRVTNAPGALLDNAGQLFGYWIMATEPRDKLAMPVGFERLQLHSAPPPLGTGVDCLVRIRHIDQNESRADLELVWNGHLYAAITGWTDVRFMSDERMWEMMRHPERNVLSVDRGDYFFFDAASQRPPSRDWLMRRFLGEEERREMLRAGPRRQRYYLNGRIAAKDAVRTLLWKAGHGPIFPVEARIENDSHGRPLVRIGSARAPRISIAHSDDVAVVMAAMEDHVGIDVERVGRVSDAVAARTLSREEEKLLRGLDREEWLTNVWAAKEAVAKLRGTGLQGNPRRFVMTERSGNRLKVDGTWVGVRREGDYAVAFARE